jgi:hypothetical protein
VIFFFFNLSPKKINLNREKTKKPQFHSREEPQRAAGALLPLSDEGPPSPTASCGDSLLGGKFLFRPLQP